MKSGGLIQRRNAYMVKLHVLKELWRKWGHTSFHSSNGVLQMTQYVSQNLPLLEEWSRFPCFPIPVTGEDISIATWGYGMVDGKPNAEQQSCCSMAMFVSAQQAPTGRVSMGERWTPMGHPLTCSWTSLAGFGVLYFRCPSDIPSYSFTCTL